MRIPISYKYPNPQRGQSALEFAMVLPILLLIAFGTIEFGRAYFQYNTLSKGIRDGARHMSEAVYNTSQQTAMKNLVVYGNINGTGNPILPGLTTSQIVLAPAANDSTTPGNPPNWVTVSVNAYPFSPIVPMIRLNATFSPSIQMRYVGANASF
jgi:Flp pilus assembly protein TadG